MDTDRRRAIMHKGPGQSPRYFLDLWVLLLPFAGVADLWAAAPLRSGQPYAEAELCARADVIFCEDFNCPQNFQYYDQYSVSYSSWTNAGLAGGITSSQVWQSGRQINPASNYPTKPNGVLPSGSQPDSVWVGNWDFSKGTQGDGSTWGILRNSGGNYRIISTAYIGPPSGGGGSGDTTPPAAPGNLRKR